MIDIHADQTPLQDHVGNDMDETWYLSGKVRRYHATYGYDQTTADHQWGVAMFIIRHHPNPSKALLIAALVHDAPEFIVGDTHGPAKRFFAGLKRLLDECEAVASKLMDLPEPNLTKEEGLWLKLADMAESLQFATLCVPEPFRSRYDFGKANDLCHNICEELGVMVPSFGKFWGEPKP